MISNVRLSLFIIIFFIIIYIIEQNSKEKNLNNNEGPKINFIKHNKSKKSKKCVRFGTNTYYYYNSDEPNY